MLGFDQRAARSAWTAALVLLLLWLVYLVRTTLLVFTLALLFAFLLAPLVDLLDRIVPGRTRTPALALAYLIVVAAAVALGFQLGQRVAEEAAALARKFPAMAQAWQQPLAGGHSLQAQILEKVRTEVVARSSSLISGLPEYSLKILSIASNAIYVVIIPVLAFFFLKDGALIRAHVLGLVEAGPRRALLDELISDANLLLAHYMRALVVLSAAAFATYAVFFSVIGVPYAILLAAAGGLLEFIPLLGPLTAAVLIILVAALTGVPLLLILAFLAVYRAFQDYILSPHVMGRGVELHPLLILFGVFAGAEIAGVAGAFLSVPVLALARIVYLRIRRSRLSAHPA